MRLPFAYQAEVLRSSRHRIPDHEHIREDTYVLVEEVDPCDLIPALRTEGACHVSADPFGDEPFLARGDQLYRRPRKLRTGAPFDAKSFDDAISPRYQLSPSYCDDPENPILISRGIYPTPGIRWSYDGWGVLYGREEAELERLKRWKPTRRFQKSTREAALGTAQMFLPQAVLLCRGEIYLACSEPVWAISDRRDQPRRVQLRTSPKRSFAWKEFRLDRLDAAQELACLLGSENVHPGQVELLDASVVQRDDEWMLADSVPGWVLCSMDRQSIWKRGDFSELPRVDFDRRDGRAVVRRERVHATLDAVERFVEDIGDRPIAGSRSATEEAMRAIAHRWKRRKEEGGINYLTEDDHSALSELDL